METVIKLKAYPKVKSQLYYELASVWYGIIDSEKIYNNVEFWLLAEFVLEGDIAHRSQRPWNSAPSDFSLLPLHPHLVAFSVGTVLTEAK